MNHRKACTLAAAVAVMSAIAQNSAFDAALNAFNAYDFDTAEELLDKYVSKRKRDQIAADRIEDPYRTGVTIDRTDDLRRRIDLGRNMLERVEKIVIIDTLTVDRYDFFRHFRLNPASGSLNEALSVQGLPAEIAETALDPVYITEDGDAMMWGNTDDDDNSPAGKSTMSETSRLADGSWASPRSLFDRAGIFADDIPGQLYSPYIMPDGVTLYFAADGPQSLGGLDIFIARRENSGSFLQPSNIGMPYNSPANDFMMAIDEVTGAGWWASDRDTDDDHVKIYVFKPSDLRVNYDVDTDNLPAYAMLREFENADEATHTAFTEAVNHASHSNASGHNGFQFAMPDGRIITKASDFRSPDARGLISDWNEAKRRLNDDTLLLQSLRSRRSGGDRSCDTDIINLERKLEADTATLKRLSNDIVRAEQR